VQSALFRPACYNAGLISEAPERQGGMGVPGENQERRSGGQRQADRA